MLDPFSGSGTAAQAPAAHVTEDRHHGSDLPPGLDPDECPIICRHFYGVDPNALDQEEVAA